MTGQFLLDLMEQDIFKDPVMDVVINEFTPDPDAFLLTDAFLPFKLVERELLMDLIQNGAFGRTNPVNLDADHKLISIPGASYKEHIAGHWREAIQYGEEVLQRAMDPANPKVRMGEKLVTDALNVLALRLDVNIEYLTSKILIDGQYSEAHYGVNYTYNPNIPAKYMLNVTGTVPWTTGGTWDTAANATPIDDILGLVRAMRKLGLDPDTCFMSVNTMEKFYAADATQALVTGTETLALKSADRDFIFNTMTRMNSRIDSRLYAEETNFSAASAASDTTLDVDNATAFTAGDVITLRNLSGQEEERTISSISSNTITISAGTSNAYVKGDRVTVYLPFLPDDYVIIKAKPRSRAGVNNWISTPSIVKSKDWKKPQPGRYTWSYFNSNKPPYWLEVGAGISGGPKVSMPTWIRLKVVA